MSHILLSMMKKFQFVKLTKSGFSLTGIRKMWKSFLRVSITPQTLSEAEVSW
jgi:hypothetical protein